MVYCNKCRCETDIEIDDAKGISCCVQCGCVLEDIAFSADVTFQKDAAGESTVVGQFVNESGVARGIGRIHGGRVYAYQADSHERAQQRGRQDIAHLVDQLSVRPREETIESSHRLYKLALQRGFTRGRRTNQVAAACLYLVCRQDSKPFLLIDFSDALQVNVFTLGAVFLQLTKLLRLEEHPLFSKPVDPSLYIHRFADRMEFPSRQVMDKVAATAMRLVASMKRDWIQTGRRPSGVCGAALYIAAHLHGFPRAKKQVVQVVHIGEHTLSKRLTEFSSTEASQLNKRQFEERVDLLEAREVQAITAAEAEEPAAEALAGCEHLAMGEAHFKQGMCRQCFTDFVKKSGGTFDGSNPPAFSKNRQQEAKKAAQETEKDKPLALPAPGDEVEEEEEAAGGSGSRAAATAAAGVKEGEEEQQEEEEEDAGPSTGKKAAGKKAVVGKGGKAAAAKKSEAKGKCRGKKGAAAAAAEEEAGAAAAAAAAATPSEDAGGVAAVPMDTDGAAEAAGEAAALGAAAAALVNAQAIAAAEQEVDDFESAIAEAEAADQRRKRPRMSVNAAGIISAVIANCVRDAAVGAGAQAVDAEAAAEEIVPQPGRSNGGGGHSADGGGGSAAPVSIPSDLTAAGGGSGLIGPGAIVAVSELEEEEEEEEEDNDGNLSEISDGDIAMYLADEAEVACKEEIWNLMNQDWVEKQAAKKAAQEAAERAQAEQRAAMEAAAAAGIQYKRGRGRPLGSKSKPKPDAHLPPAESAQEAAMRMLDNKKLSSKINYSALADLFSDEAVQAPAAAAANGGASGSGTGGSGAAVAEPLQPRQQPAEPTPSPSTQPGPPSKQPAATAAPASPAEEASGKPSSSPQQRPPVSRIAGLAPRGATPRSALAGGPGRLGASRLGGLTEGLPIPSSRPLGAPLGGLGGGLGGLSGLGSLGRKKPAAEGSGKKVSFATSTKSK